MTNSPVISVIIPVFNQERYLDQCVRSVLNQNFHDFEVILVNDGSTDRSLEICQKYVNCDSRFILINKKNEGVVLARRDGVLKASGEYIFFLDSDDYLVHQALFTLYHTIREKQVDLVVSGFDRVLDNWGIIKLGRARFVNAGRLFEGKDVQDLLWGHLGDEHDLGYMWGRLYRRDCILDALKHGQEELFPSVYKNMPMEDVYFNISLAPYIKSVWILNDVIVHYRYGGYTSRSIPLIREGGIVFDKLYFLCNKYNRDYMLPQIFKRYIGLLNMDLLLQVHFKSASMYELKSFLEQESKRRRIFLWANENLPEEEKTTYNKYLGCDSDSILTEIVSKERSLWMHYLQKKIIIQYQRFVSLLVLEL